MFNFNFTQASGQRLKEASIRWMAPSPDPVLLQNLRKCGPVFPISLSILDFQAPTVVTWNSANSNTQRLKVQNPSTFLSHTGCTHLRISQSVLSNQQPRLSLPVSVFVSPPVSVTKSSDPKGNFLDARLYFSSQLKVYFIIVGK